MRPIHLFTWLPVVLFLGHTLQAHPGDDGYWLVEVSDDLVRSRILFPDHLQIQSAKAGQQEDRVPLESGAITSPVVVADILREHLTLQIGLTVARIGAGEFVEQEDGFLELAGNYSRPAKARSLMLESSLHQLSGEDHAVLCRVIGGEPERFVLNAQNPSVEVELKPVGEATGVFKTEWLSTLGRKLLGTMLLLGLLGALALPVIQPFLRFALLGETPRTDRKR